MKTLREQEYWDHLGNVTIRAQIRSKESFYLRPGHQNFQSGPECVTKPIQLFLPINTCQSHYSDKVQHSEGLFEVPLKRVQS